MRIATRISIQYWAMIVGFYGGLGAAAAWIGRKTYLGINAGVIEFGKNGREIESLTYGPVRFWLAIGLHGVVVALFVGMICYVAWQMDHGRLRQKTRRWLASRVHK